MTFGRALRMWVVCGATLAVGFDATARPAAAAETCKQPQTGTKQAPILSPPMAAVVTGSGRLQFYSAPNVRCPMDGVFVIPKDRLIAYAETDDGWSSVMYVNPKTGNDVSGWVRSARLKKTGTVGPRP